MPYGPRHCLTLNSPLAPFDVALFFGFRAEGPAIYLAQPAGSTREARNWANIGRELIFSGEEYFYKRQPVGYFKPNPFGLYDMHGNLAEWCSDWFDPKYYDSCPREDPPGPKEPYIQPMSSSGRHILTPSVSGKVHRGGWYEAGYKNSTSSHRAHTDMADDRLKCHGFRVVCEVGEPSEVTRRQYQDLFDYEAKVESPSYKKALQDSVYVLRDRWKILNSDEVPAGEEWLIEVRERTDKRGYYACDIFETLASIYNRLGQPGKAHIAYLEVVKQRLAHIDLMQKDPKIRELPDGFDNRGLAYDYFNLKDYDKAIAYANHSLRRDPNDEMMIKLKERIRAIREAETKK